MKNTKSEKAKAVDTKKPAVKSAVKTDDKNIRLLAHSRKKSGGCSGIVGAKSKDALKTAIESLKKSGLEVKEKAEIVESTRKGYKGFEVAMIAKTEKTLRFAIRNFKGVKSAPVYLGANPKYLNR